MTLIGSVQNQGRVRETCQSICRLFMWVRGDNSFERDKGTDFESEAMYSSDPSVKVAG